MNNNTMNKNNKRKYDQLEVSTPLRPCDNHQCHICMKDILPSDKGMLSTVPRDRIYRLKPKTIANFKINWNLKLNANTFHCDCWDQLQKSSLLSNVEKNTMISVSDSIEIYETSKEVYNIINDHVASLFRNTSHNVCFTGAGISASSGIPTYRGSEGIDTIEEHAKKVKKVDDDDDDEYGQNDYTKLQPSLGHKALKILNDHNYMHYIITQNCDSLHNKAGFPRDLLCDLHGNVFTEYCESCLIEVVRDYEVDVYSTDCFKEDYAVKCKFCSWNHYTGRRCDQVDCNGKMKDTIINFGDDLHDKVLGGLPLAEMNSLKADCFLAIGSSLSVYPACNLIKLSKNSIIVNPQVTDFDDMCTHRIWTTSDIFFDILLQVLNIPREY